MKEKKFDAVMTMREIRDKLSKRYSDDLEAEERDLQDIRKKYGIKFDSDSETEFFEKTRFLRKENKQWIN